MLQIRELSRSLLTRLVFVALSDNLVLVFFWSCDAFKDEAEPGVKARFNLLQLSKSASSASVKYRALFVQALSFICNVFAADKVACSNPYLHLVLKRRVIHC